MEQFFSSSFKFYHFLMMTVGFCKEYLQSLLISTHFLKVLGGGNRLPFRPLLEVVMSTSADSLSKATRGNNADVATSSVLCSPWCPRRRPSWTSSSSIGISCSIWCTLPLGKEPVASRGSPLVVLLSEAASVMTTVWEIVWTSFSLEGIEAGSAAVAFMECSITTL